MIFGFNEILRLCNIENNSTINATEFRNVRAWILSPSARRGNKGYTLGKIQNFVSVFYAFDRVLF